MLEMIQNSFMSRANTMVVPGGKMSYAMEIILSPIMHEMIESKKGSNFVIGISGESGVVAGSPFCLRTCLMVLSGLNPEQRAAVTLPDQSALILAGAGSGKTRVLTTRIAYLISTGQVSPHSILAVTFTNKAAKEMLTRLSAMLPINTRGMWIGTFHGLCNRMLRAHYREANCRRLSRYSIAATSFPPSSA